jgi:hypothetical protein
MPNVSQNASEESAVPQQHAADSSLAAKIHSASEQDLLQVACSPELNEDLARALFQRRDLSVEVLVALAQNHSALKIRAVLVGLVSNPKTPRHISIPLTRHLFTFELMQVVLQPAVPADLKMKIEEALMNRMNTISAGERITLAKRGSTRIAAGLLTDTDPRILEAALNNPYMTEAFVAKALSSPDSTAMLFEFIWRHPKWSLRTDVRIAMLRAAKTPPHIAQEIVKSMSAVQAKNALSSSRISVALKAKLLEEINERSKVR